MNQDLGCLMAVPNPDRIILYENILTTNYL